MLIYVQMAQIFSAVALLDIRTLHPAFVDPFCRPSPYFFRKIVLQIKWQGANSWLRKDGYMKFMQHFSSSSRQQVAGAGGAKILSALMVASMCCLPSICFANNQNTPQLHPSMININPGGGLGCDPTDPSNWWPWGSDDSLVENKIVAYPPYSIARHRSSFVRSHDAASRIIGTTPQEVHRNFALVIEAEFQQGAADQLVRGLSDRELINLARLYQSSAGRGSTALLNTFARRLSEKSLLRVASVFDRGAVAHAVAQFSRPSVQRTFMAQVDSVRPMMVPTDPPGGLGGSGGSGGPVDPPPPRTGPTPPNIDQTLNEIYLEFRNGGGIGSLSRKAALSEVAEYAGKKLVWEAGLGAAIGTFVQSILETYFPDTDDAIGGTVSNIIDQYHNAVDQWEIGHYQAGIDQLFDYPITDSSNLAGDWEVTQAMADYYIGGGTCGW